MKETNLFKKVLVSSLALAMIVGGSASAFAQDDDQKKGMKLEIKEKGKGNAKLEFKLEFKDVGKGYEWASKHIASLASEKVFEGYLDGTFKPNKPVTRIEAVATAIRLMGLKEEAESDEAMGAELSFKDAKNIEKKHAWATGYLALAVENELITDVDDKFKPERPADRIWVAELLVKALGLESEAEAKMNVQLDFKDSDEIPAESVGYVVIAVDKGIVRGYTNNTFKPNKPVTRAELAAFLDRTGDHLPEFNDGATRGTVTADVYENTLFIAQGSQTLELNLDPDAFIYRDGIRIASSELEIGDEVKIRSYNDVVIFIEVTKQAEEEEETTFNLAGTLVSAISSDEISIEKEDQTTVELSLSSDAKIYRNGEEVEASELKVSDELLVHVIDNEVVVVQVTKTVEEIEFTVGGLFKSMTLNAQGKISTIEITTENSEGDTQDSIYNVSEEVIITGDFNLLVLNNPIELQGETQLVTSIEIK